MMRYAILCRVLGLLLMLFSLTLLAPAGVALWYQDGSHPVFLTAFLASLVSGLVLFLPTLRQRGELRTRDGFLITALFWLVIGSYGSLPFMLSEAPHLSVTDALFESISGLTTTGATVLTGLDDLPRGILFYRQLLQWLGGIGIIVIAVAILPMLGIGGMQLYRAEAPGPVKDSKLTPRITGTAKALFLIYVAMTLVCALAYWLAGMTPFDAVGHSFSTVAIGGFSTHDASMGYFDSPLIHSVAIVFMAIAGVNFALHYYTWTRYQTRHYGRDPEFRFYLFALIGVSLLTIAYLSLADTYAPGKSIIPGLFQVVSIATTTGFTTTDFSVWPSFLPTLLLFYAFMGGCAGSTAGGIKVIRVLLMLKQGLREIRQLVHPQAVIPVKLARRPVPDRILSAVWSFVAVYVAVFMALVLLLQATGLDFITSFSAAGATLNNLGPGLGDVASNYAALSDPAKVLLCFAMLLGRLEIFTVLVLFSPMFWRK